MKDKCQSEAKKESRRAYKACDTRGGSRKECRRAAEMAYGREAKVCGGFPYGKVAIGVGVALAAAFVYSKLKKAA